VKDDRSSKSAPKLDSFMTLLLSVFGGGGHPSSMSYFIIIPLLFGEEMNHGYMGLC
jgi:hypothetical protein